VYYDGFLHKKNHFNDRILVFWEDYPQAGKLLLFSPDELKLPHSKKFTTVEIALLPKLNNISKIVFPNGYGTYVITWQWLSTGHNMINRLQYITGT
jgi:hypothetical protein